MASNHPGSRHNHKLNMTVETNCWGTAAPIWQFSVQRLHARIPAAARISERVTPGYCNHAPHPIPLLSHSSSACYPSNRGWFHGCLCRSRCQTGADCEHRRFTSLILRPSKKKKKTCIHTQTKIEIKAPTRTYYYCITGGHEWLTWPSDGIHLHFFLSVCPQHIWETCKHLLSANGMHPICTALLRDPKVKHRISEIHSQMHWLPFALKSSAEISQSWRCARPSLMA